VLAKSNMCCLSYGKEMLNRVFQKPKVEQWFTYANRSALIGLFATIWVTVGISKNVSGSDLTAFQDEFNDTYLEGTAGYGFNYQLQRSDDLKNWSRVGIYEWGGLGQRVSLLVRHESGNGHKDGAQLQLPEEVFTITPYSNGHSLIAWRGTDGNPYQVYLNESYFGSSAVPLVFTDVADPEEDYRLLIWQGSVLFDSSLFPTLVPSLLPDEEQETLAKLTQARQQVLDELASASGDETQTADLSDPGEVGTVYYRLLVRQVDSDNDGLANHLELEAETNPYDPDTDRDGVVDPWDLANLTNVVISEFCALQEGLIVDEDGDYSDWIELYNPTPSPIHLFDPTRPAGEQGWYLSDESDEKDKWRFPDGVSLDPGESLVIFASGKQRRDPSMTLHTNFKISTTGSDDLFLVGPDGETIVDGHTQMGVQRRNASAGWAVDQATGKITRKFTPPELRFFLEPTPGEVNSPESCKGFAQAPVIDTDGGIYATGTNFSVTVFPKETGTTVHYTLDGSNPTDRSPQIAGPIEINSTSILRAIAAKEGCPPSPIVARSYLFLDDVLGMETAPGVLPSDYQQRPPGYPLNLKWDNLFLEGNLDEAAIDFAMDPSVIAQHRSAIKQELLSVPSVALTIPVNEFFSYNEGMYSNSSFSNGDPCGTFPLPDPLDRFWKRLASVEYIDPTDPGAYVQENAEIAISGATSRNFRTNEKHSLRSKFRSRDSVEGKAGFEFADFKFPFAEAERKRFNQLMLRNPYQDSWTAKGDPVVYAGLPAYRPLRGSATYIRDAWAREMHRRMNPPPAPPFAQGESGLTGNPIANRRWVHLYINGLYWGGYELGERIDEGYGRYHENPMADFDVLKPFLPLRCSPNPEEPKYIDEVDGSVVGWDQMIEACRATVASNDDPLLWAEFTDKIDLNNYIDYLIINMFMHNTDWDGNNNWRALRNRDNGKFKFLVWDAELTMNPDRIFEDMTSGVPPTGYTQGQHLIPHKLMTATNPESAHPEYLAAFKARVALHFETPGGVFSVDGDTHAASQIFQETMDQFETVRLSEWARWGDVREFDHPDYPYSPGDWEQTAGGLRDGFVRDRRAIFLSQLRARGLAN